MRQKYWTKISRVFLVFAVIGVVSYIPSVASASCVLVSDQQTCSNNYAVGQAVFNSGGVNQCPLKTSSAYCANISVGDLTDGNASSGNAYQTQTGSGFVTHREPFISFSTSSVTNDIGYLPLSNTATVNANFTVQTYLAGGYIVQVSSPPPTDNVPTFHKLATPGSPTTPSPGTEMFGMNLISNSSNPGGGSSPYGANPQCTPSTGSFCPSGALTSSITSNYNQNGKYYYPGSGTNYTDTLVNSNTSTGSVSYTLSFVYDISNSTPDGLYTYNGIFVATSTY